MAALATISNVLYELDYWISTEAFHPPRMGLMRAHGQMWTQGRVLVQIEPLYLVATVCF